MGWFSGSAIRGTCAMSSLKRSALEQQRLRKHLRKPTEHCQYLLSIAGNAGEKTRKLYQAKVDAINKLEPSMQALSDEQLRGKTKELQDRVARGTSLDDVLVEAFAVWSYWTSLS